MYRLTVLVSCIAFAALGCGGGIGGIEGEPSEEHFRSLHADLENYIRQLPQATARRDGMVGFEVPAELRKRGVLIIDKGPQGHVFFVAHSAVLNSGGYFFSPDGTLPPRPPSTDERITKVLFLADGWYLWRAG